MLNSPLLCSDLLRRSASSTGEDGEGQRELEKLIYIQLCGMNRRGGEAYFSEPCRLFDLYWLQLRFSCDTKEGKRRNTLVLC